MLPSSENDRAQFEIKTLCNMSILGGVLGSTHAEAEVLDRTEDRHRVLYVPLPHEDMRDVQRFYRVRETAISFVNDRKNAYSLNKNTDVSVTFGDKDLPSGISEHVNRSVCQKAANMRDWYHMFGFVGVFDPDTHAERNLEELSRVMNGTTTANTSTALGQLAERRYNEAIETASEISSVDLKMVPTDGTEMSGKVPGEASSARILPSGPSVDAYRPADGAMVIEDNKDLPARTTKKRRIEPRSSSVPSLEPFGFLTRMEFATLEDGRFFVELDRLSNTRRVVYARNRDNEILSRGNIGIIDSLVVDPSVTVFVWPGKMPMSDGSINTNMLEIMRQMDRVGQFEENLTRADRMAVEGKPVFEPRDVSANFGSLVRNVEQEMQYPRETRERRELDARMREEGRREVITEAVIGVQNRRSKNEYARYMASQAMRKTERNSRGAAYAAPNADLIPFRLPSGFVYRGQMQSRTVANIQQIRQNYYWSLSMALTVPVSVITGAVERSDTRSMSLSHSQIDKEMRDAIEHDRRIMREGIEGVWNSRYRARDNLLFANIIFKARRQKKSDQQRLQFEIERLESRLQVIDDAAEATRLVQIRNEKIAFMTAVAARLEKVVAEMQKISAMAQRLKVSFNSIKHISLDILNDLQAAGGISQLEYINIMRQKLGIEAIEDESELEAIAKRRFEMEEKYSHHAQPKEEAKPPVNKEAEVGEAPKA